MKIELRGVGIHNSGAELMFEAIRAHYAAVAPDVEFVVAPAFGSYKDRATRGLLTRFHGKRWGRSHLLRALLSPGFRSTYGLAFDSDIDAVLDVSGFAYGDQWGFKNCVDLERYVLKQRSRGVPFVLLPQALGPFEDMRGRRAFGNAASQANLVCARDKKSLEHIMACDVPMENVLLTPDFTHSVQGIPPLDLPISHPYALIVPNCRMLDKTDDLHGVSYIAFLETAARFIHQCGIQVALLLHSRGDEVFAGVLQTRLGFQIPVIQDLSALQTKGVISRSHLVVGSRYHALISAMSQNVPALGCGWSHKYETMFADFGCPELMLSLDATSDAVVQTLDLMLNDSTRAQIVRALQHSNFSIASQSLDMWHRVDSILGLSIPLQPSPRSSEIVPSPPV